MSGPPVGVAAIPAAPLMLPAVAPRVQSDLAADVRHVRAAARAALARIPPGAGVLLLATDPDDGPPSRVIPAARVDLDGLGVHGTGRRVRPDDRLVARLAAADGMARGEPDGPVPVDLASLLLQVVAADADRRIAPVALGAAARPSAIAGVLDTALEPGDVVVVAGDLSAGLGPDSPRYDLEGAGRFDRAALTALQAGDGRRLTALGSAEARRLHARGWLPLAVALLHAARRPDEVTYRPVRGVGQVVASWAAA